MLSSRLPWKKWWCEREETGAGPLVATPGPVTPLGTRRRRHLATPAARHRALRRRRRQVGLVRSALHVRRAGRGAAALGAAGHAPRTGPLIVTLSRRPPPGAINPP